MNDAIRRMSEMLLEPQSVGECETILTAALEAVHHFYPAARNIVVTDGDGTVLHATYYDPAEYED